MSRFSSIDPVGILNACTTKVRMKNARITAITIDSKYSRSVDFLNDGAAATAVAIRSIIGAGAHFQHGQKRFLRDLDLPDAFHAFFTFFLLFQQLSLPRDVAAVALGEDVLAQRLHSFARDDAAADGRLDG